MFTALNQLCIPLIGLIHGGAFGGGVGLVTVCDHVVCEEETQFSLSEVRLGLIPACIGPFVLDKIGAGHCRSLFISGERISAPKALVLGLVHQLVKGVEGLDEAKEKLKKTYSQCGPRAVQTAKKFLRELKGHSLAEQNELAAKTLADLRVGAEAQEGIRAFLEKRKPQW
jgi:methylglutaconyl-CoA hydratase